MTDERKQELLPFAIINILTQTNPDKYQDINSAEQWQEALQTNKEDVDQAVKTASEMSDEEWDQIENQYTEQVNAAETEQAQYAAKGAKLKRLSGLKKTKKCKCGCNMVDIKEKGGKITSVCACRCGGKMNKDEKGGFLKNKKGRISAKKEEIKKNQKGAKLVKKPTVNPEDTIHLDGKVVQTKTAGKDVYQRLNRIAAKGGSAGKEAERKRLKIDLASASMEQGGKVKKNRIAKAKLTKNK